jgi:hypothetical protein
MSNKDKQRRSRVRRWLGIDFTGNYQMWRAGRHTGNVWIAEIREEEEEKALKSLVPVQQLAGAEAPFHNLINLLNRRDFDAAAIDAPFSVPSEYLPPGGHQELLDLVSKIERSEDRPFPSANDFLSHVLGGRRPKSKKPLRKTERHWRDKNVNVRSTLWSGPRGGAAMTSACLTLLCNAQCPIWPWDQPSACGLLVEAFPAAQLCHWSLCYQKYNGRKGDAPWMRQRLVSALSARVTLNSFQQELEESADALDAVLCAFAAIAVTTDNLANLPNEIYSPDDEGLIAVCN